MLRTLPIKAIRPIKKAVLLMLLLYSSMLPATAQEMLMNPLTGKVPADMRKKELEFIHSLPAAQSAGAIPWKSRGLFNAGGRTRAIAIDLNNENILLAGGNAGLWRSEDQGKSWKRITKPSDLSAVTCVIQDRRLAFRNVWYYSTGERVEGTDISSPPLVAGSGIFKSADGGRTFTPLTSTIPAVTGSAFSFISGLAIHPATGDLLVATATGILKSSNGGLSFSLLLNAAADKQLHYTEVMFTPAGILYATLSSASTPARGIYRSVDGGTTFKNITPTGFPASWGRIVMNFAPSEQRISYFFGYNKGNNQSFLFKYKYSGNPAKADAWYDFTPNLTLGRGSNQVDVHRGYAMMVSILASDTNSVLLGGVNLDYSGTGFSRTGSDFRFGGSNASIPSLYYPGHHTYQHQLLFFPSNAMKAVSATDGGIFLTGNILQDAGPGWISLNNGYNTTEINSVSLDPYGTDTNLLAAIQHNGSWSTGSASATAPWTRTAYGNTDFTALYEGGKTRVVSTEYGDLYKLTYASGITDGQQPSSVTYLSPARTGPASGFLQSAVFAFDATNRQVLYYPQSGFIWRNLHLDNIPAGNKTVTTVGWKKLGGTQLPGAGSYITALITSRLSPSNRLYYGSNKGEIFRLDNANIGDKPALNISAGKGLPAGYVSSIAVDPANGDHLLLVFSNYGIKSIYYSPDAGTSWASVSGNLEQFPDGSGNGPSIRWISVAGNNDRYLVGTSTGLFAASSLQGDQTVWTLQSPDLIGDALVPCLATRDDGYTAVASHGNGVFEGIVPVTRIPAPSLSVQQGLYDRTEIAGGPVSIVDLNTLFKSTDAKPCSVSLYNSDSGLVDFSLAGHYALINYRQGKTGTVTLGLVAGKGAESVSIGFDLLIRSLSDDSLLYSQFSHLSTNFTSSENISSLKKTQIAADDFFIPMNETWTLDRVRALGSSLNLTASYHSINIVFFTDSMGKPGNPLRTETGLPPLEDTSCNNLYVRLRTPLKLRTGHYWISVIPDRYKADTGNIGRNGWGWATQAHTTGEPFQSRTIRNPLSPPTGWVNSTSSLFNSAVPKANLDLSFLLYGSAAQASSLLSLNSVKIFSNPNHGYFKVRVPAQTGDVTLNLYSLQGEHKLFLGQVKAGTTTTLNISVLTPGAYILKMHTRTESMSVNLVKD